MWLEPVSKAYIEDVYTIPDIDNGRIRFNITGKNLTGSYQMNLVIKNKEQIITDTTVPFQNTLVLSVPEAKLWTPENPQLYSTAVTIKKNGKITDQFNTYFAMRKISLLRDANGYLRLALNNKPVFHLGTLDQGWWPDGLLTPPSEEAMMYDIVKLKEMGFNTIRKHIKVEPSRYYYMADSIGVLLWQDMPSGMA